MNPRKALQEKRQRRVKRTRAKLFGSASQPRLAVFRSNKYISVQLIDDATHKTLASASSREMKGDKKKTEKAQLVGTKIAEEAKKLGIEKVIFDRRAYRYHGRVRAVAEGARAAGLTI